MKVIAFTAVYNEEEYIAWCARNTWEQGLVPLIIDNGCTDKTLEIARSIGISPLEHKTEKFDVYEIVRWASTKVKEIGCDWYMLKDADEMLETYGGRPMLDVVMEADRQGYNCIRFDDFEFWMTVDDDQNEPDFTKRILYYTYLDDPLQRLIKNDPEIWLQGPHTAGGAIREYPIHLPLRHYKFISMEQGKRKVQSRLNRFITTVGSNTHYNKFTDEDKFYVLPKDVYPRLHKFTGTWVKTTVFNGWR